MAGELGAPPTRASPLWSQLRLSPRPGSAERAQAGQADSQRAVCRQFLGAGALEEVRVPATPAPDGARTAGAWFRSVAGDAHRWAAQTQGFGGAAGGAVCPPEPGGLALADG